MTVVAAVIIRYQGREYLASVLAVTPRRLLVTFSTRRRHRAQAWLYPCSSLGDIARARGGKGDAARAACVLRLSDPDEVLAGRPQTNPPTIADALDVVLADTLGVVRRVDSRR